MKVYERLLGRTEARSGSLSIDDWAGMFAFNGNSYPILHQTMPSQDEEQVAAGNSAAYRNNGPVFALIQARIQVFSQIRFQWTRFDKGQPTELFGTEELSVLENPWPGGTTADLLARMEMDASRAGNAYVRRTRRDRLNMLRPEWLTIVMGSRETPDVPPGEAADVEIAGFIFDPPNADARVFFPHEVAHYAPIPDPDAHFLGMSWITPVLKDMQADNASTVHKDRFFRNAATPNLAIKFDPAVGPDKVLKFKELMEAEHRGAWNAYKTLYLGGGADPVAIGKDFRELDFSATQGKGESRLAAAAGVPPSWVGFSEGLQGSALNQGNQAASRRRFGDGTMQHLWANAAASLQPIMRPPQGASLWFDADIPFMREDAKDASEVQSQEAATITGLVRDGFTPESAIDAVTNKDWSRLKHTGLVSVQMQKPGSEAGAKGATDGA